MKVQKLSNLSLYQNIRILILYGIIIIIIDHLKKCIGGQLIELDAIFVFDGD
ncbi:hypothetical protein PIROE2DRAFT_7624 [Piromyces sp. E2]|nr:hypothetical protein PIROE2DRAFT_7624 [Piromyces sp. E2]|eukprot:OUM65415.1 hypothetical protein PIROE2DRAFT_7624 [Piromyces sp. E2]